MALLTELDDPLILNKNSDESSQRDVHKDYATALHLIWYLNGRVSDYRHYLMTPEPADDLLSFLNCVVIDETRSFCGTF